MKLQFSFKSYFCYLYKLRFVLIVLNILNVVISDHNIPRTALSCVNQNILAMPVITIQTIITITTSAFQILLQFIQFHSFSSQLSDKTRLLLMNFNDEFFFDSEIWKNFFSIFFAFNFVTMNCNGFGIFIMN